MTKIAIIGDVHIGVRSDSENFVKYQNKWFKWFFEYAEQNGVTHIIQEGDLLDRRKYLNYNTLNAFTWVFKELEKYETIVISGNHDCYYKSTNEVNSVNLLLGKHNVKVIDMKPETIKIGKDTFDFFPWISPENFNECMEFVKNSKSDFAVGHFEFNKFEMHPGQLAESGMDHKLFSKYKRVYSGHYHSMSAKDNILYTGIPYELDWSDCDNQKGFWMHDETNPQLIKNPFIMYKKIYYDENFASTPYDIKDMYVKVFATNKTDQYKFDRYIESLLKYIPYDLKVIENSISDAIEEHNTYENIEAMNTIDIILATIDSLNIELDKDRLKSELKELYTEAIQTIDD